MPSKRYLMLQRSPRGPSAPAGAAPTRPSPAQMQEMFAQFNAWKEKFKDNIVDMGGKLAPDVKIVTSEGLMDGPFVEAKEIVGGYMIVTAHSFEEALAVAKESPGVSRPGSQIEIREIADS
jgi:hypothetical protein